MTLSTPCAAYRGLLCAAVLSLGFLSSAVNAAGLSQVALPSPKPSLAALGAESKPLVRKPVALPHFRAAKRLTENDAARYAHVFAFQEVGDWDKADEEIQRLNNSLLMGHVLYQRYMHADYKASYEELKDWLASYADHPNAQRLYDLAARRGAANGLKKPVARRGVPAGHVDLDKGTLGRTYVSSKKRNAAQARQVRTVTRSVQSHLGSSPTRALKVLDTEQNHALLDRVEYDQLRADIAASFFYYGRTDTAFKHASAAADRSGEKVPTAGWIAGLAAWKNQDYATAAKYFEQTARSEFSSSWMVSAGAFWAARSHLRNREPAQVSYWMQRAAEYPRSFYGIIAVKALGLEQEEYNWQTPRLTDRHIKALLKIPAGRRAMALIEAGQADRADQELRQINPGSDDLLKEALVALSDKAGLPALSMRLGGAFKAKDGKFFDAALYPVAPWVPENGFAVDLALVYAFIRQESKFDPSAANRSGATGLMQLMPQTASHVAGINRRFFAGSEGAQRLLDPMLNIDLGQRYLSELLSLRVVDNNLFKLAVAYNAGPGKLARWERQVKYEDDPLFFIEAIPAQETRLFVERVMANYWIYRLRFNQKTPSLDHVAAGQWPLYVAQNDKGIQQRLADAANRFWQ